MPKNSNDSNNTRKEAQAADRQRGELEKAEQSRKGPEIQQTEANTPLERDYSICQTERSSRKGREAVERDQTGRETKADRWKDTGAFEKAELNIRPGFTI